MTESTAVGLKLRNKEWILIHAWIRRIEWKKLAHDELCYRNGYYSIQAKVQGNETHLRSNIFFVIICDKCILYKSVEM